VENNIGLFASSVLFLSLIVPWTITWGTNIIGFVYSQFYIFEFPFMSYYVVSVPGGFETWWDTYEFAPRYLGAFSMVLGGVLAFMGGNRRGSERLIRWGGVLSVLAIIFFTSCRSADITINYPVTQSYTVLPMGLFMPVLYWVLVLLYSGRRVSPGGAKTPLYCGYCGGTIFPEFNLCPFCGHEVKKPTCPRCGRDVTLGYAFCPFCGVRLNGGPVEAI
jgi:RNA polymerase subunit RPABC4/transcription elongation factor Spt4